MESYSNVYLLDLTWWNAVETYYGEIANISEEYVRRLWWCFRLERIRTNQATIIVIRATRLITTNRNKEKQFKQDQHNNQNVAKCTGSRVKSMSRAMVELYVLLTGITLEGHSQALDGDVTLVRGRM